MGGEHLGGAPRRKAGRAGRRSMHHVFGAFIPSPHSCSNAALVHESSCLEVSSRLSITTTLKMPRAANFGNRIDANCFAFST